MTTSVLTTHTRGYLNDNDLQVIRDFALEAPWEWRLALETLVEDAKTAERIDEVEEELIELRDSISDAEKALQERLTRFQTELAHACRTNNLPWVPGSDVMKVFTDFKEDMNDALQALREPKKPEAAQSVPVQSPAGPG